MGQKGYQVESMAAESSDIYVRMGRKRSQPRQDGPARNLSRPVRHSPVSSSTTAVLPPDYINDDKRYFVSVGNNNDSVVPLPADYYGTKTDKPAWLYPEDGRYVPGPFTDPANYHESGDTWVADAAMEIMAEENWSGLFVTLSAMDKIGHMWGGGSVDDLQHYTWDSSSSSTGSTCRSWPRTPTPSWAGSSPSSRRSVSTMTR